MNAGGPTSAHLSRPGAVSGLTYSSLFESDFAPPVGGAADPAHKTPVFPTHTATESCFAVCTSHTAPPLPGNTEGGSSVALKVKGFDRGGEMLWSAPVVGKPTAGALLVDTSVGQCSHPGGNQQVGAVDLGGRMSKVRDDVPTQPQVHSGMLLAETVRHTNHNPFLF